MRRLIVILAALSVLFVGTFPCSAAGEVIYRATVETDQLRIALTFDDGPHPKYTPQILDILKEYGIKATFFCVGTNVELYPALVERIAAEGHELGNHTHHHNHVLKMSTADLRTDIGACSEALERTIGRPTRFFRPPEGVCNDAVKKICSELGMTVVMWSVDTRDWAHPTVAEICKNVRTNTRNGSIILMHDFIGKNSPTPEALRQIIPMLQALGFEFVTVSQLLSDQA